MSTDVVPLKRTPTVQVKETVPITLFSLRALVKQPIWPM